MPMEAATRGTLSTTALARPMRVTMIASLPTTAVSQGGEVAEDASVFQGGHGQQDADEEDDAAQVDAFEGVDQAEVFLELVVVLVAVSSSPASARGMPRPKRMPANGGRWVMLSKIGTEMRVPMPMQNTKFCSNTVVSRSRPLRLIGWRLADPDAQGVAGDEGMIRWRARAQSTPCMMFRVVIWPIHKAWWWSVSPIDPGAAGVGGTTMMPAANSRSSWRSSSLFFTGARS